MLELTWELHVFFMACSCHIITSLWVRLASTHAALESKRYSIDFRLMALNVADDISEMLASWFKVWCFKTSLVFPTPLLRFSPGRKARRSAVGRPVPRRRLRPGRVQRCGRRRAY